MLPEGMGVVIKPAKVRRSSNFHSHLQNLHQAFSRFEESTAQHTNECVHRLFKVYEHAGYDWLIPQLAKSIEDHLKSGVVTAAELQQQISLAAHFVYIRAYPNGPDERLPLLIKSTTSAYKPSLALLESLPQTSSTPFPAIYRILPTLVDLCRSDDEMLARQKKSWVEAGSGSLPSE